MREPVLKTGGGKPLVSSSLTASAETTRVIWSNWQVTDAEQSVRSEIRVQAPGGSTGNTVPWSNGNDAGSHPGNDGSIPSGTTLKDAQVRHR